VSYSEKVVDKINAMEQRSDERKSLWRDIIQSFEQEGADGVESILAGQIGEIREKFDALVNKLEEMA